MARLGIVGALQPSAASRINLHAVEHHLRRYSACVQQASPEADDDAQEDTLGSQKLGAQTFSERHGLQKGIVLSGDLPEIIKIDSDSEDASSEIDEEEIWADAFEYQEKYESSARLSQASVHDKENQSPDFGAQKSRAVQAVQVRPARSARTGRNSQAADARSVAPTLDYYACLNRGYEDIPLPRQHKASGPEEYFTLQNNPTKFGKPPIVIYVTNEYQLNNVIGLLQKPILSLDLEWVPWSQKKQISLIQLSDAQTVLLIQISRFQSFPHKLKDMIEDPSWIKCGVSIMGADASRLRDVYKVWAQGICELSYFARLVNRKEHGPENRLISLSKLAHHYLGAPLAKGDVRCSDWSQFPLSKDQREYAACDAYAGYLIFAELERLRQSDPALRNIWPPVRACPPYQPKTSTTARTTSRATRESSSVAARRSVHTSISKTRLQDTIPGQDDEQACQEAKCFAASKVKSVRSRSTGASLPQQGKKVSRCF